MRPVITPEDIVAADPGFFYNLTVGLRAGIDCGTRCVEGESVNGVSGPPVPVRIITDAQRIYAVAPTVAELADLPGVNSLVVMYHQGRYLSRDYIEDPHQHAERLTDALAEMGREDLSGRVFPLHSLDAPTINAQLCSGGIAVLPNVRSHPDETDKYRGSNMPSRSDLIRTFEGVVDVVVADDYSVRHRPSPSVVGWNVPLLCSLHMKDEVASIEKLSSGYSSPTFWIVAGLKVDDYFDTLESMLEAGKIDRVLAGGGFAELGLAVKGYEFGEGNAHLRDKGLIGDGPYQNDLNFQRMRMLLGQHGDKIDLPMDLAVERDGRRADLKLGTPRGRVLSEPACDIGHDTIGNYISILRRGKPSMTFIKGPMGKYEDPRFVTGTREVLEAAVAHSGDVFLMGGNTNGAAELIGLPKEGYRSTLAGGAAMEGMTLALRGRALPGVQALYATVERALSGAYGETMQRVAERVS
ncbi:MAG: phosphoglycerate kinase [archaeon]